MPMQSIWGNRLARFLIKWSGSELTDLTVSALRLDTLNRLNMKDTNWLDSRDAGESKPIGLPYLRSLCPTVAALARARSVVQSQVPSAGYKILFTIAVRYRLTAWATPRACRALLGTRLNEAATPRVLTITVAHRWARG